MKGAKVIGATRAIEGSAYWIAFGGQLDEYTRISTDYAQNLPNHWD